MVNYLHILDDNAGLWIVSPSGWFLCFLCYVYFTVLIWCFQIEILTQSTLSESRTKLQMLYKIHHLVVILDDNLTPVHYIDEVLIKYKINVESCKFSFSHQWSNYGINSLVTQLTPPHIATLNFVKFYYNYICAL